jgi:hypothetical protein
MVPFEEIQAQIDQITAELDELNRKPTSSVR